MRRKIWRKPHVESFEERIALTASACGMDRAPFGEASTSVRSISSQDDTTATAIDLGELSGPQSLSGYVGRFDQRDVFRFDLPSSATVDIRLEQLTADADIFLLDGARTTVARSENWGTQDDFISNELDSGEYFLVVGRYSPWSAAEYNLTIESTVAPPDGAGSTFATAADIGVLQGTQSFGGAVGFGNDQADLIQFDVAAQSRVRFDLTGLTSDVDLFLYSSSQTQLQSARLPGAVSESLDTVLSAGTYYLGVFPFGSSSSEYSLTVSQFDATPPSPLPEPSAPSVPSQPLPSNPNEDAVTPVVDVLPDVAFFGTSGRNWGLNEVGAPEAWEEGYLGQGVTVAIVDSGVQLDHPDLQDSVWINEDEILGDGIDNDRNGYVDDRFGWDFVSRDNNPNDSNSHGNARSRNRCGTEQQLRRNGRRARGGDHANSGLGDQWGRGRRIRRPRNPVRGGQRSGHHQPQLGRVETVRRSVPLWSMLSNTMCWS